MKLEQFMLTNPELILDFWGLARFKFLFIVVMVTVIWAIRPSEARSRHRRTEIGISLTRSFSS
jgi:hypothetical protein